MAVRRGCHTEVEEHGMEMVPSSIPGGVNDACKYTYPEYDEPAGPRSAAFRVRRGQEQYETVRILGQMFLVFAGLLACTCAVLAPFNQTRAWHVPGMVIEATFGPTDALWHLSPPLMNRTRYETPGNFWRPVMFPPKSFVGTIQDLAYGVWNWGVRNVYLGPVYMKVFSLFVTAVIWIPTIAFSLNIFTQLPELMPFFIRALYLRWMPEGLLILEQLIVAKKLGRKLSKQAAQDVTDTDLHATGRLI
jgi:hypothetical protein